ncbi:hypothetical protein WDW89_19865 [Deltaproteobacteria bacterium TL4]
MRVVRNRFEQLIKSRGVKLETRRQMMIELEAFDKLANWAMDQGIYEKQMFYTKVSAWIRKHKLPKVALKRDIEDEKRFKDIDELVRERRNSQQARLQKVAPLRMEDEAYQILLRWGYKQGVTSQEELSSAFSSAVLKTVLPGGKEEESSLQTDENEDLSSSEEAESGEEPQKTQKQAPQKKTASQSKTSNRKKTQKQDDLSEVYSLEKTEDE